MASAHHSMEIDQDNIVMDATSSNFLSSSISTDPFFYQEGIQNNLSPSNYLGIINDHSTSGFMFIDDSVRQEHLKVPSVSPHQSFHSSSDLLSQCPRIGFSLSEARTIMPRSSCSFSEAHNFCGTEAARAYGMSKELIDYRLVPNQNMHDQLSVHPSFHVTRPSTREQLLNVLTSESNDAYGCYNPRNELALSLCSSQPSVSNRPSESEQGLGISCAENLTLQSDIRYQDSSELYNSSVGSSNCMPGMRIELGNEPNLPSVKDLSQYYGSFGSPVLRKSKYVYVLHELLAEVTSYIQTDESICASDKDLKNLSFSCSNEQGLAITSTNDMTSQNHELDQSQETTSEKSQLLTMLQLVDFRYNQCVEELQNVTSAFCNKTEYSIPQFCSYFSLHTVTILHKNLRGRIIHSLCTQLKSSCEKEQEKDIESSFFHKQWALQQLRKTEDSWRPQRGLPENSVSVLRAWMFQNFLHPYPKDDEKNLLAIKSGLTRSQVSNWFINARVRLWKPMIEELYSEIRKAN